MKKKIPFLILYFCHFYFAFAQNIQNLSLLQPSTPGAMMYYFKGAPYTGEVVDFYGAKVDITKFKFRGNYVNGQPKGHIKQWYPNRQLEYDENYGSGGIKDGLQNYYYENGKPKEIFTYKNGQLDGKQTRWHSNGQKESENTYLNGVPTGKWTSYDEKGQLISEEVYQQGQIANETSWYPNGKKASEKTYPNGGSTSKLSRYDETGQLIFEEIYQQGQIASKISWYANGKKASEEIYSNGIRTGKWTTYDEKGQMESEKTYQNGVIVNEEFFKDNVPVGTWKKIEGTSRKEIVHINGKIKSESNYLNNIPDGKQIEYFEDGKAKEITYANRGEKISDGIRINNKKDGKWMSWSDHGEKIIEETYKEDTLQTIVTKFRSKLVGFRRDNSYVFKLSDDDVFIRFDFRNYDFKYPDKNVETDKVAIAIRDNLFQSDRLIMITPDGQYKDESINYVIELTDINVKFETGTVKNIANNTSRSGYMATVKVSYALKDMENKLLDSHTAIGTTNLLIIAQVYATKMDALDAANKGDYVKRFISKNFKKNKS